MSRPKGAIDAVQSTIVAAMAPIWQAEAPATPDDALSHKLQIENQLLKSEVLRMQELVKESFYLKKEIQQQLFPHETAKQDMSELKLLFKRRLESIPAKVIFRASGTWNSFLWIDVGSATNESLGRNIIAKNSPVVVGNSLVGVIDYVGKGQSRVRLITDSDLLPAVRSVRGQPQAIRLIETINVLLDNMADYDAFFEDSEGKNALTKQLEKFQYNLTKQKQTDYLAKGELHGASYPQFRSHGNSLKGIGFNCDYNDDKGPARDLRSGIPYVSGDYSMQPTPLLKVHDILVTSGMDGIFPEGLFVAEVSAISPLEEGAYYYELEAKPTAGNLDSLSLVFVMAPHGFDPSDK